MAKEYKYKDLVLIKVPMRFVRSCRGCYFENNTDCLTELTEGKAVYDCSDSYIYIEKPKP